MKIGMQTRYYFYICFLFIFLFSACQQAPPPDPVSIQLKWVHQAQFAGFYTAKDKGYYADENLDVTLLEGGPDVDVVQQVVSGNADLGIYSPEDLLIQRDQGDPVVAVAVIYQRNPMVFVSKKEAGITAPQDILGKRVSVAPDGEIQFSAMMEFLNLDIEQVNFVPYSYDYQAFYENEVDVTEAYSTGGLLRMERQGVDVNTIWPEDYGVHFYSDTIFSTDHFIEKHSDVVERFLRATMKGWQDVIEDPEEAVDHTLKYALEADSSLQRKMLDASIPLIHTGQGNLGTMSRETWMGMAEILYTQQLLSNTQVVDAIFSNEFIDSANKE